MLGMFFGSVVGSQIADWYGRRLGFLGATLLLWVGSMASFYAPHPVLYAVARFLCGAGVTSKCCLLSRKSNRILKILINFQVS